MLYMAKMLNMLPVLHKPCGVNSTCSGTCSTIPLKEIGFNKWLSSQIQYSTTRSWLHQFDMHHLDSMGLSQTRIKAKVNTPISKREVKTRISKVGVIQIRLTQAMTGKWKRRVSHLCNPSLDLGSLCISVGYTLLRGVSSRLTHLRLWLSVGDTNNCNKQVDKFCITGWETNQIPTWRMAVIHDVLPPP